jgi:hypothetical protein
LLQEDENESIPEALMQRSIRLLLLWALILSACSAISAAPQTVPPGTTEAPLPTTAVPDPKPVSTVGTPHIEQPPNPEGPITSVPPKPGECGYQWAYQDLPELSSNFQQSIQSLQAEAQASAYAFGENCVRADGSSTFLPMETDFNITLQVSDLTDESDLGEWIGKVMQVITAIRPEQILGPRPGRVSLIFQSGSEQKGLNFYINQFQELPAGLSNAEIFQALQVPQ